MVSHTDTPKTLVFSEPTYPQLCTEAQMTQLVPGDYNITDAANLAIYLEKDYQLLISFQGGYFPKAAWDAILQFLERGGNLAIFGGMPFSHPVTEDGYSEPEQDIYTRQIYLGHFFQLPPASPDLHFSVAEEAVLLKEHSFHISSSEAGTFWSYNPKMTQVSDRPGETGTAGTLDTFLQPLIYALATNEAGKIQKVATPAAILDQRSGRFQGGRWLISPWRPLSAESWLKHSKAIQQLISLASLGACNFEVRPSLGSYQPGEPPTLIATTRTQIELQAKITIYPPESKEALQILDLRFSPSTVQQTQSSMLSIPLTPGLYRVHVEYQQSPNHTLAFETGFWIWDEQLVASTKGKRLTAQRDYFYQEGRPFLVYGTTYMDSRIQRKFLHLPNPARWDHDFQEMKAAGINLIRTGIWTTLREFISLAGVANETFLRALDALVLTACKYNVQLVFTFFTFSPERFEGSNPWLDPRSLAGQEDYLSILAGRYAKVELLSWDLINEPSFGNPKRIFSPRPIPNHDIFEITAFRTWLQKRYSLNELQLRWRQTPTDLPDWSQVLPPQHEADFESPVRNTAIRAMAQVADFTRFSQEVFQNWSARMIAAIRASGSQTLVGVGQDESATRIAPQFYTTAVDYTTTHPWWNLDDMLWDMLLDKTPEKPNLIQETGIMQLRDTDGSPWRSQQENADLLERKLYTGLIARSAGLVQWLWHTNSYMDHDNENSIGLVRADGTAKPELEVFEEFGRLSLALDGRLQEEPTTAEVWVVVPYEQWFTRDLLGRAGTQQAIRVLGYDLGVIPQVIGDNRLETLVNSNHPPRLVILPALQLIETQAWQHLLTYVQAGGTLLVSGVITRNAHNLPFDPTLPDLDTNQRPIPVSRYEEVVLENGQAYQVTFGEEKISYIKKANNQIQRLNHGKGTLIWCGLPLELASTEVATRALYAQTLAQTVVKQTHTPVLIKRRAIQNGTVFLVVSESGQAQQIELAEGLHCRIEANRAGALLLNKNGEMRTFGGLQI